AGYRFKYAGENLAVNFDDSVAVDRAWMASPSHRANLMSDRYTEIGIAMATGTYKGRQTVFIVQLFGTPAKARPAPVFAEATSTLPLASATGTAPSRIPGLAASVRGASTSEEDVIPEPELYLVEAETIAAEEHLMAIDPSVDADLSPLPFERPTPTDPLARASANPSRTLGFAYLALGALVLFALMIFIGVEIRKQHPLHIAFGVAFLFALGLLFVIYRDVFFLGVEIL
ncbi:MAG TPA: CAP domain-containing protein, partial [Candidatus Paceibacterota bacterium]|nr:CAP domain-containing protein [Candidatus Paceibacterota bacterium]